MQSRQLKTKRVQGRSEPTDLETVSIGIASVGVVVG